MPAYNFKVEFAPLIEGGRKRQTIRKRRRRPTKVGDILYLYTGMRTKNCRSLGRVVCAAVHEITITEDGMELDGAPMVAWEQYQMAYSDGFDSIDEFRAFFRTHYGLPFHGVVIQW